MKHKFLDFSKKIILDNNNYTEEEMKIILYGLEGLYLTISKMIILFALAIVCGCVKEFLLLLITFNLIRSQAFGIHASKSIYCLISSTTLLFGGTILCMNLTISYEMMIVIAIICDICLMVYAPADTKNRPIINIKKRKRFKASSFLLGIIYTLLITIFKDSYISNYLLIGMVEAVIMILPITYSIFNLPYNNYKTYNCNV